jgi:hypothetical protein
MPPLLNVARMMQIYSPDGPGADGRGRTGPAPDPSGVLSSYDIKKHSRVRF